MKKILAILLAITMIFAFVACGEGEVTSSDPASSEITSSDVTSSDETSSNEVSSDEVSSDEVSSTESTTSTEASHTHNWGSWKIETVALVNRVGTEKRTCSGCTATETRENTDNVLFNSFDDPALQMIFYFGFNQDGSPRAYSLLLYAPYKYHKFAYKENSTDTIYEELAKCFVLDSSFKDAMRAEGRAFSWNFGYDEAKDTFTFDGLAMGSEGEVAPLGYIHNGGNQYTVYYEFEPHGMDMPCYMYKVVLEFNRTDKFDVDTWKLNGAENKYLSFEEVSSVPDNLIK